MRASTMGILALAIFVGLGATAAAKYAGVFDSSTPPVVKEEPIKVLVAKSNLFSGTTITGNDVMVVDLDPKDRKAYEANKDRYAPGLLAWANFRVPARNIPANQIIMVEDFQDLELAKSLPERIAPGMKGVQLSLPKDRAVGGMLPIGSYVDVVVTSSVTIPTPNGDIDETRTAVIARDAKIIVKRNNLWTVMASDPDNKDVSLTIEVNPYRAALIEYAKSRGTMSIVPSSGSTVRANIAPGAKRTYGDSNSAEYRDEDNRVALMERGEMTVGDNDLMRIFNIRIPAAAPPPPPPHRIEMVSGIGVRGTRQFENTDGAYETNEPPTEGGSGGKQSKTGSGGGVQPSGGLKFIPAAPKCKTCGKKK